MIQKTTMPVYRAFCKVCGGPSSSEPDIDDLINVLIDDGWSVDPPFHLGLDEIDTEEDQRNTVTTCPRCVQRASK